MIIGTRAAALFRKFQKQYLGLQFFMIGVPLFPTSAFYGTERDERFEVPMRMSDVLHVYSRFYLIPLGLWLTVIGNNRYGFEPYKNEFLYYLLITLGFILMGVSLYSWIFWARPKKEETRTRRILGKVLPYNMPPEYLSDQLRSRLFLSLEQHYQQQFPDLDWKDTINNNSIDKANFPILYALAYYDAVISNSETSPRLERLKAMLKKK